MPFPLPNLPRFGDQLRDQRTLRGLTIEQVAEAAGLAPSALRELEAGKRAAPGKDVVRRLAEALGASKEDRQLLLESAEWESPLLRAVFGERQAAKPALPSLTAAILVFLIADIRGYTRFTQEHGDEAAAALTVRFAALAQGVAERWDGHLVEVRGDEVLAVFASARQAVRAARDLQERYDAEAGEHPDWPLGIGIGLDVGEAAQVEDGYRGAAVNRAARLCSLAAAGEVLVSTGIVYLAPHVEGVTFAARGQAQLKGLDGPTPILLAAPSPPTIETDAPATEPGA